MKEMVNNLAELFFNQSRKHPEKIALCFQDRTFTFSEMTLTSQKIRTGLRSKGLRKGDRVLLMAPLSAEFYSLVIALMAIGAVPVFVDTKMGIKNILSVIQTQKPKMIFSVKKFWTYRLLFPQTWSTVKYSFDSDGLGVLPFKSLLDYKPTSQTEPLDFFSPGIITFTSGSTGRPKGADRSFGILFKQHELSQKYWPEISDEVDMPCFPMIALQNMACGITTILPKMDLRNPALVQPELVIEQIEKYKVTRMSGSPAYLLKILEHLENQNKTLPQIRSLIAGGATVPDRLCRLAEKTLPNSENYIVYGSTEVEPISYCKMKDVLANPQIGFLVGKPLPELNVKIVKDLQNGLGEFSKFGISIYETSEVGEILISGPHVVQRYFDNPIANQETKLIDPQEVVWHRTGDLGYFDEQGRIVLVGRQKDQIQSPVGPIANYMIEKSLEEIPGIQRAGLIDTKNGPVVFIETSTHQAKDQSQNELPKKIETVLQTFSLAQKNIHWIDRIPVDHRHNWKINREQLRKEHSL